MFSIKESSYSRLSRDILTIPCLGTFLRSFSVARRLPSGECPYTRPLINKCSSIWLQNGWDYAL